ncbi:MAG: hypothetical protein WA843_02925 [Candidatus Saccharimonadales bacterium]
MKTLREWDGDSNELVLSFLRQFNVKAEKISLLKYEALTPDSFIWIFNTGSGRYCLYTEDYVPSIDHVKKQMDEKRSEWNPDDKYELLRVSHDQEWDKTRPVTAATTYRPPEKPEEFMQYAATSGFDFVFLAKVIN